MRLVTRLRESYVNEVWLILASVTLRRLLLPSYPNEVVFCVGSAICVMRSSAFHVITVD